MNTSETNSMPSRCVHCAYFYEGNCYNSKVSNKAFRKLKATQECNYLLSEITDPETYERVHFLCVEHVFNTRIQQVKNRIPRLKKNIKQGKDLIQKQDNPSSWDIKKLRKWESELSSNEKQLTIIKEKQELHQQGKDLHDLQCRCGYCGKHFIWSGYERSFYYTKGLNRPKYCQSCREVVKSNRNSGRISDWMYRDRVERRNTKGRTVNLHVGNSDNRSKR